MTASRLPEDDLGRAFVKANSDATLEHLGVAGNTYTILLSGSDTGGKFCLIDMHVPPGGGPPPHRHDFEETFSILLGEIEATVRGETVMVRAGETVNVPANAPHHFRNSSTHPARMLCFCAPPGQEEFFREVGVRVATRTAAPPELDEEAKAALKKKMMELTPKYRTELLAPAS